MSSALPGPTASTPLLHAHNASRPGPSRSRSDRSLATSPASERQSSLTTIPRLPIRRRRPSPSIRLFPAVFLLAIITALSFAAWDISSVGNCYFPALCRAMGRGKWSAEEVWARNVGAYAPYSARGDGGGLRNLPRGCEIDQVNILHRHTARYPTTGAGQCMRKALDKIAHRETKVPRRHRELAFLEKADLSMTGWRFDELMNQGRKVAWRSGKEFGALYQRTVKRGEGVFSRSAGGARVVETGRYWMQGFHDQPFKILPVDELPPLDLVIPECETCNNTLSVHNCPAYEKLDPPPGVVEQQEIYPFLKDPLERLNRVLRPQPVLDYEDLVCLSDMCAFDSQRHGTEWLGWSPWCEVFENDEWEVLGYLRDVERFYEVGHGSVYGKTMGAGWINELIARLTDAPVEDTTTTNRTLDSDNISFPLGGKRLFVDFLHDNEMIEIITAMNILPQHRALPLDEVPRKRTFQLSSIIPFGARLVVERIACDLAGWEPDPNDGSEPDGSGREGDQRKDYVRILLNDKILPVDYIDCKQSGFVEHDMCEVEAFLASQQWAREDVDWGVCDG